MTSGSKSIHSAGSLLAVSLTQCVNPIAFVISGADSVFERQSIPRYTQTLVSVAGARERAICSAKDRRISVSQDPRA